MDAGLRARGVRRLRERQALRVLFARGAEAPTRALHGSRLHALHRHRARVHAAPEGDGSGALQPFDDTDDLEKPCYDYKGLARASAILDDLTRHLRAVGIDVYQIDHEDANGQFEINFTYADALRTADNLIYFKMAASEVARS